MPELYGPSGPLALLRIFLAFRAKQSVAAS